MLLKVCRYIVILKPIILTMKKDAVTVKLGVAIRQLREDFGLSQEDLADKADLHRTYIGSIERGERNVSIINIVRIARALDHTSASLLQKANL